MRALVYDGPGALGVRDVEAPQSREGHTLIRVVRAGVCGTDRLIANGGLERVRPPVVLGHEFGGVVAESVDAGMPKGALVAVEPTIACLGCSACERGEHQACPSLRFLGVDLDGGAAEFVLVPTGNLHLLPDTAPAWVGALAEPVAVAVHMCRRAGVSLGDSVLIAGGGPIGALVASVCNLLGAAAVTVAEPNGKRRALLESAGFTCVDPTQGQLVDLLEDTEADVAFELAGARGLMEQLPVAVRPRGTILFGALTSGSMPAALSTIMLREQTVVGSRAYASEDFRRAIALLGAGRLPIEWIITDEVPFAEVREGLELVSGDTAGMKTLIAMPT